VSALILVLDGGEFTVCKVLRSLVQAGLVEIDADPSAAAPADTPTATPAPPAKAGRTAASQPRPEPDVEPDAVTSDAGEVDPDPLADGLDRGAVVAMLASARSK